MFSSRSSYLSWLIPVALVFLNILLLWSVEQASAQGRDEPNFVISVESGDRYLSSTIALVYIRLYDERDGQSGNISINEVFQNDLQNSSMDVSYEREGTLNEYSKIIGITIWKEDPIGVNEWFIKRIVVENRVTQGRSIFPIFRWVESRIQMNYTEWDTALPQNDPFQQQREAELALKRETYVYSTLFPGSPVVAMDVPKDEQFSPEYQFFLRKTALDSEVANEQLRLAERNRGGWTSIYHMMVFYNDGDFYKQPNGVRIWDIDSFFSWKRVASVNPEFVKLVCEIPDKFPVTDALLGYLLEGMTIAQAIAAKKLFIVDLSITDSIRTRPGYVVCSPIALFYLNQAGDLMPVAIQLFQDPGADNPIFTPENPEYTWQLAKMWFNNADAQVHYANTHFATKHLFMEGIALATHRQLSPSHPIFKILAPHFLYTIGVNSLASASLFAENGLTNAITNVGVEGVIDLIQKRMTTWRMDVDGMLPEDLKRRGVDNRNTLHTYPYRDDGLLLFKAIKKYANNYAKIYYPNDAILIADTEIQNWVAEIVAERNDGGVGLLGVPGDGSLTEIEQLVDIVTSVIFTCSADHSAVSSPVYEEFGFPLNYPMVLHGTPPANPTIAATEEDILAAAPDVGETLGIMGLTTVQSSFGTNPLGDFEIQYISDTRALPVVEKFRRDLASIGIRIEQRNHQVMKNYTYLIPEKVANSISI